MVTLQRYGVDATTTAYCPSPHSEEVKLLASSPSCFCTSAVGMTRKPISIESSPGLDQMLQLTPVWVLDLATRYLFLQYDPLPAYQLGGTGPARPDSQHGPERCPLQLPYA